MEILLFVIGAIVLFSLMSGGSSSSNSSSSWTPSSGGTGSSTSSDNRYFGPPEIKLVSDKTGGELDMDVKRFMYRGKIPVSRAMDVSVSLSAFDITEGEDDLKFVISLVEAAQEESSICFGLSEALGNCKPGEAYTDWVQLGAAIPELMQPPRSGRRKIRLAFRMFNTHNPPTVQYGFGDGDGELLFFKTIDFTYNFTDKGYEEESEHREESQAIALKIGVAVAMADGHLDDSEGQILKDWIVREISAYGEEKQNKLKTLFNDALKEAFADAQNDQLSLSPLVERLAEIGEKKSKYDAIELCFDVMAADGQADPEEMRVIRTVADALDLDMDEIEAMREKVTLNLSTELSGEDGLEALVGLRAEWSNDEKKTHLRKEFQKWSNRLNALDEGEEREQAQNMLDSIAKLRKKYG